MSKPSKVYEDRILRLASTVELQPDVPEGSDSGFSMTDLTHPCGTPSCLAGWCLEQMHAEEFNVDVMTPEDYLGLPRFHDLFIPESDQCGYGWAENPGSPHHITAKHAAECLRHYADTGEVNWRAAAERLKGDRA